MIPKIKIGMGLKSVRVPQNPSEPGYVAAVQQQVQVLTDTVQNLIDQIGDVSEDIMLEALEPTLKLAQMYTPYQTGELRNSGYLERTGSRTAPRVEIGFARGGHPRYAMYVHEMTETPHKPPTQAKFLQRAVLEDLPNIYQRLGHGYAEAMNLGI